MPQTTVNREKFPLGRVVITCGAEQSLPPPDVKQALKRHQCADWGDVSPRDWTANNESVKSGTRLLSSYIATNGVKFWIITEADREATTVLLPDEY